MLIQTSSKKYYTAEPCTQGSVIGPILFLIYINDLPDGTCSQVRLFTDDSAVYVTIQGKDDGAALHCDLYRISVWESMWNIGSRNPINTINMLHCQGQETGINAKYLWLDVSSTLS